MSDSVVLTARLALMIGHRQVEKAALFYEFSLEKHVPPDHLLRKHPAKTAGVLIS